MKIKRLLIGMLACSALVACTNDDVLDNPNPNDNPIQNQEAIDAYVSVKLIMGESTGSRTADGGYLKGDPIEQQIIGANSVFLFYDNDGNWVTSGQLMSAESLTDGKNSDESNHDHGKDKEGNDIITDVNSVYDDAYIVLSGPDQELKKSTQVLTIVNYNAEAINAIKTNKPTLKEVLPMIASNPAANAGFLMTTSMYMNGTTPVQTTAIVGEDVENDNGDIVTYANIQSTQELAKQNPVKIYIERASAKVQLTTNGTAIVAPMTAAMPVVGDEDENTQTNKGDESGDVEGADIVLNGEQTPVGIIINGWTVNNVNTETYLVKQDWSNNMPTAWNTLATWNQANDYRSYWAVGTKWNYAGSPTITTDEAHELVAYTYNDAISTTKYTNNAMYCYEQTVSESNIDPTRSAKVDYPNSTTVLVAAQIALPNEDGEFSAATEDLFKYGGVFYTEAQLKTAMMNLIDNYWVVEETTTQTYVKADEGETVADADKKVVGEVTYKLSATEKTKVETNLTLGADKDIDFDLVSNGTLAGIQADQVKINLEIAGFGETVVDGSKDLTEGAETFDVVTTVKNFVKKSTTAEGQKMEKIILGKETIANFSWVSTQNEIKTLFNAHDYITDTVGYNEGKCYYQIPIEHLYSQTDNEKTPLYGVVRNHWYKLNISSVKHIGEPVYDPSKVISTVPAKSTDYYLAAELHVLNWHVVNQDVTLE